MTQPSNLQVNPELAQRIAAFMAEHIYPNEVRYAEALKHSHNGHAPALLQELKAKAKAQGLWNLFLPGHHGAGLSHTQRITGTQRGPGHGDAGHTRTQRQREGLS